jgi:hypothetical protein
VTTMLAPTEADRIAAQEARYQDNLRLSERMTKRHERRAASQPTIDAIEAKLVAEFSGVKSKTYTGSTIITHACPACGFGKATWDSGKAGMKCPACARKRYGGAGQFVARRLKSSKGMPPETSRYGIRQTATLLGIEATATSSKTSSAEPVELAIVAPMDDDQINEKLTAIVAEIRTVSKANVESIFVIGERLKVAHDILAQKGKGTFIRWVEGDCKLNRRTARNYMAVWVHFGHVELERLSSSFSAEALYALSSPNVTDAMREKALEFAGRGGMVNREIVTEIVKVMSPPKPAPEPDDPMPLIEAIESLQDAILAVARRWPEGQIEALGQKLKDLGEGVIESGGLWA